MSHLSTRLAFKFGLSYALMQHLNTSSFWAEQGDVWH